MRFPHAHQWMSSSQAISIGCFAFIFILMLTLNSFTPLWGDDWWRALNASDFPAAFERIGAEYTSWTGRVSVLFLTFVFLLKYPGSVFLFNLVNSAVFCLLLAGMFRAVMGRFPGRERQDAFLILLIFCGVWFFTHAFGESVLWKTGAIAYLWVITAAIFLMTPYVELLASHRTLPDTKLRLWGWPLFAFFWGMGLENVAVACVAFMAYCLIAARLRGLYAPRWYWFALLGQVFGTLILVCAPGNFVRFATQDDGLTLWVRFGMLAERIWVHCVGVIYIFTVIAGVMVLLALLRKPFVVKRSYLWFMFGLTLAFAMLGSTGINFGTRTSFVAEVVFVVALMGLVVPLLNHLRPLHILPLPVFVLVFSLFAADVVKTFDQYWATWHQTQRRSELMDHYRESRVRTILMPSMTIPYMNGLRDDIVDRRYFLRDIHPDVSGNGWRNGTYASYHGFSFSNRIKKPYLIFAPELKSEDRFKPVGKVAGLELYASLEHHGRKRYSVLYVVGARQSCSAVKDIHVYPVDIDELPPPEQKLRHKKVRGESNVAWINSRGKESNDVCISRFQLPDWDVEKVTVFHSKLDWPHSATLDWSEEKLQKGTPLKFEARLEWRGCELIHANTARVDTKNCLVSSTSGIKDHLVWGPYHPLSEGRYILKAHYSSKHASSHWDVVMQLPRGPHVLGQGTLKNTSGKSDVMTFDFAVHESMNNRVFEFRLHPKGKSGVTLERIVLEKIK